VSAILRHLPFYDHPTTAQVSGCSIVVKRDQIIVWVSLSEMGSRQLDPRTRSFPAILDTGCNHSFVIGERHLMDWADIQPGFLRRLGPTRLHGKPVPQFAANVWLRPNQPGHRDEFSAQPPFLLETNPGIAVVPATDGEAHPRLPLLGLPTLRWNHLQVLLDGDRSLMTIRTPRRFWFFG
jgi:hypothetical protein